MYIQDRHFSLSGKKWDISEAKAAIQEIATDATDQLKSGYLWPTHPLDDDTSLQGFYFGSGVSWALEHLKLEEAAEIDFKVEFAISKQLENCQKQYFKMPHSENASYLFGDIPILMMQYQLSKNNTLLDELHEKISVNNFQPTRELMWGSAGTMIGLTHLHRWLPDDVRWKKTFLVQAKRLINELQEHKEYGFLWEHDVYGNKTCFLGPVHGNSGNSLSLIKGKHFFDNSDYDLLCEKIMISTVKTAVTDNNYANWPTIVSKTENMQLHHCRGAPGIINALSELPTGMDREFDQVLIKGGELTWAAGPLRKGHGLCHGTAGNGFSFLKLFQRTKDEIWLDRARLFAMEGIEQYRQAKALFHQGRYSLWNGDVGLAIYINECCKEMAQFPTIDTF
ncbi:MAG: LanC-like protein [Aliivibrio sp.]|uniref:lanthionine synthetase C family protein n=1 Tax=Aliivibrio sp. TaxID=1872443 RepID=UPI001A537350|nr:LanC-like protein [Aliivibrio sp.]